MAANRWRLEGQLALVTGASAGIGLAITRELLVEANERGGEENVSTGWHAIEFLLWGQDFADDGPGTRPYTDFVDGKRPNADRRRQYLEVVTALLIDDLQSLVDAWAPARENYRAAFEAGRALVVMTRPAE